MSLKNWLIVQCFVLGLASGAPLAATELSPVAQIVVIGEGQASAAPDKAIITLGARHSAKSAVDALSKTSDAVAAILSRMEQLGIESKDMQTASISLDPVWGKAVRADDGEMLPPVGFEASNTVRVTLRELDKLGLVLDTLARGGANSFSGFRFGVSDAQPVQDRARKAAVADARRKAGLYAEASGVNVGDILLITEELGSGGGFAPPVMEMALSRSGGVPLAQGEITQSASIKVIFALTK